MQWCQRSCGRNSRIRNPGPAEIRVKVAACGVCRTGQKESETYQIRIPTGVQAGESIRVSVKGEAVLGATVPLRTLEGTVPAKVAAGTRQGHLLRVRDKGLPAGAAKRGDLYLEVSIQVPTGIGNAEERLSKRLASESTINPRKAF